MAVKQRISTCLWFNENGEEAANFYASLFPNSRILNIIRYDDEPMSGGPPPMPAGTAMLVRFELGGTEFAALNGGPQFKLTEAASLVAVCEDQKEIDRLWTRLTANGGAESMCGWLKDRFGVSWQIIPEGIDEMISDPKRGRRVMEAIMTMKKIDIAKLKEAYN